MSEHVRIQHTLRDTVSRGPFAGTKGSRNERINQADRGRIRAAKVRAANCAHEHCSYRCLGDAEAEERRCLLCVQYLSDIRNVVTNKLKDWIVAGPMTV
jgi:hypothetical protein